MYPLPVGHRRRAVSLMLVFPLWETACMRSLPFGVLPIHAQSHATEPQQILSCLLLQHRARSSPQYYTPDHLILFLTISPNLLNRQKIARQYLNQTWIQLLITSNHQCRHSWHASGLHARSSISGSLTLSQHPYSPDACKFHWATPFGISVPEHPRTASQILILDHFQAITYDFNDRGAHFAETT